MSNIAKKIVIIAGPNGAGKTTFATEFLPNEADCIDFVNADLIAAGLAPFDPAIAAIQAGRMMLRQVSAHLEKGHGFAFETTLSGLGYARQIPLWRAQGYSVELFFLALPDADMAVARGAERIRQAGHAVPEEVIRRRFDAGRRNPRILQAGGCGGRLRQSRYIAGAYRARRNLMTNEKPSRFVADLAGSCAALKRAGERARRLLAEQTGTKLIVAPRAPTATTETTPRA